MEIGKRNYDSFEEVAGRALVGYSKGIPRQWLRRGEAHNGDVAHHRGRDRERKRQKREWVVGQMRPHIVAAGAHDRRGQLAVEEALHTRGIPGEVLQPCRVPHHCIGLK